MSFKKFPVFLRKKGRSYPIVALACGERWGVDEMYGRTSVVRTPRVGVLLIGLGSVLALQSRSTDILILFPALGGLVSSLFFEALNMAKDVHTDGLNETVLDLAGHVMKLLHCQASNPRQRVLVALAGVPGSGKSTVSHALLEELAGRGVKDVAIVPMVSLDGSNNDCNSDKFAGWLPLY